MQRRFLTTNWKKKSNLARNRPQIRELCPEQSKTSGRTLKRPQTSIHFWAPGSFPGSSRLGCRLVFCARERLRQAWCTLMCELVDHVSWMFRRARPQSSYFIDFFLLLKAFLLLLTPRLGENIVVGPPMSQSSSSVSINGRSTQRIILVLPIQGSSGIRAQAQVSYSNMQKEGPVYDIIVSGAQTGKLWWAAVNAL